MFQSSSNTETMEPTEELSLEAVEYCQHLGSQATKVSDIIGGKDKDVYRAIQEGIDRVNSAATSNAQRIQKWTILRKDFSVSGGELGKFNTTCNALFYKSVISNSFPRKFTGGEKFNLLLIIGTFSWYELNKKHTIQHIGKIHFLINEC